MRRALLGVGAAVLAAAPAQADTGCNTRSCEVRVPMHAAHEKWRPVVARYGIGLLRARMRCESGNHGGYRLTTTGNGYWFSMQFNVAAWAGAGGRVRHGRPAGVWTMQPSRLEQDVRAVYWDRRHGGDPWPNCP